VIAYTGFSGFAMDINLSSSSLLLCWMVALGIYVWRQPALSGIAQTAADRSGRK
jgi:hypothetical protein